MAANGTPPLGKALCDTLPSHYEHVTLQRRNRLKLVIRCDGSTSPFRRHSRRSGAILAVQAPFSPFRRHSRRSGASGAKGEGGGAGLWRLLLKCKQQPPQTGLTLKLYSHSLTSSIYQSTSHFTLALHTTKLL
eukprot:COSAG02_NODE_20537_length_826_cov_2.337001_1_plen_132_part_01